jgi:hypothetical protein
MLFAKCLRQLHRLAQKSLAQKKQTSTENVRPCRSPACRLSLPGVHEKPLGRFFTAEGCRFQISK